VRPLAASLRALRQVLPDTEPVLVTMQPEMILSCVALTLHTLLHVDAPHVMSHLAMILCHCAAASYLHTALACSNSRQRHELERLLAVTR
jgi:hypothetical protein